LRTRLEESRFARDGLRDMAGPMIRLDVLTAEEIFVLLQRLREIHGLHYGHKPKVSDEQIQAFMTEMLNRLGAEQFLTPRELVRDYVSILNLLQQHPDQSFDTLVRQVAASTSYETADPEALTPETEIHDDPSEASPPPSPSPYSDFKL
jgi:hypothetical protein